MKNFKAIPFTASISRNDTSKKVADQIQALIDEHSKEGWEYLRLESVETNIEPTTGCFGFGAQPGYTTSFKVIIFEKK